MWCAGAGDAQPADGRGQLAAACGAGHPADIQQLLLGLSRQPLIEACRQKNAAQQQPLVQHGTHLTGGNELIGARQQHASASSGLAGNPGSVTS